MKLFAFNLLIAIAWTLVSGTLSASNLVAGFVIGFGILWLLEPVHGDRNYHRYPWRVLSFVGWYLVELVRSSLRIAQAVFRPISRLREVWLEVPLKTDRDIEITLLANLITLTPGTIVVSATARRLKVHALLLSKEDPKEVERFLSERLQPRLLALFGEPQKRSSSRRGGMS